MAESGVATHRDRDFLTEYLAIAPASLALIRANECEELSQLRFPRPILDVGCGDGLFVSQLFSQPLDAGIDINPADVKRASKSGMYLETTVASATEIPFADGSFECVFSNGVLEHIPELSAALAEIARVLRAGGQLIATMPCAHFSEFIQAPAVTNRLFAHHNLMEPDGWERVLARVGLRLLKARHYNSAATIRAHQSLIPLSVGAYFVRRATGRWVVSSAFRRAFAAPLWRKFLGAYYATRTDRGGSIWWIAEKQ